MYQPPMAANEQGLNFWSQAEEEHQAMQSAVAAFGNAYYDPYWGKCDTCGVTGSNTCFFPKPMTPEEYQQWVDSPYMAGRPIALGADVKPRDIRDICASSCPFMGDSFEGTVSDLSKFGDCKYGGACAWTSPNFNGACGVLPVSQDEWSTKHLNAFTTAAACSAYFDAGQPLPLSHRSWPPCANVPDAAGLSGGSPCKTNCYYPNMNVCESACTMEINQ